MSFCGLRIIYLRGKWAVTMRDDYRFDVLYTNPEVDKDDDECTFGSLEDAVEHINTLLIRKQRPKFERFSAILTQGYLDDDCTPEFVPVTVTSYKGNGDCIVVNNTAVKGKTWARLEYGKASKRVDVTDLYEHTVENEERIASLIQSQKEMDGVMKARRKVIDALTEVSADKYEPTED